MRFRPVLALAVAILGFGVPASAQAACVDADVVSESEQFVVRAEAATLCLINEERAANGGLPPIVMGPASLREPAVIYSTLMVERKFFSHTGPDGSTLSSRLAAYTAGQSSWAIGENLGWGGGYLASPRQVVRAWMNSASHRDNILDARWVEIGIGISLGTPDPGSIDGATYTTEFGVRGAPLDPVKPDPTGGGVDPGSAVPVVPQPEPSPPTANKPAAKPTKKPSRATVTMLRSRCTTQTRIAKRSGRRVHRVSAQKACARYRTARAARLS